MKYLLSYMTMFIAMIITLVLGGGFTTVLGFSVLSYFQQFLLGTVVENNKKTERRANA